MSVTAPLKSSNLSARFFDLRWNERLGRPECPYLTRWVFGIRGYALRIHHWHSSDDSRAPHDHPYWMLTMVVKGHYTDVGYPGHGAAMTRKRPATSGGVPTDKLIEDLAAEAERGYDPNRLRGRASRHERVDDVLRPFRPRFRPALHTHWVAVPAGGCWTVLVTGRQMRPWGFWTKRWDGTRRWVKSNRYFLKYEEHQCNT